MGIDHVELPVGDLGTSRAFYTAALTPLGYRLVYESERSLGFGRGDGGEEDEPFAVERLGAPAAGSHVAFTASSTDVVDAFHAAAVAAGGRDNGTAGERRTAAPTTRRSSSIPTATTWKPSTTDSSRGARRRPAPDL